VIGCSPAEVVFTSGGTESDNLAIRGVIKAVRERNGRGPVHAVTTAIEHEAVLATFHELEERGIELSIVGVDVHGRVSPDEVCAAVRPETAIVSVMLANNEVGTLQPVAEIAARLRSSGSGAVFHTDAVQAAAHMDIDVGPLGVDLLSLSAHKLNGPKGVGLLFVRSGVDLAPAVTGGGHEGRRRAGTENVPGAVGLAAALALAAGDRAEESARLNALRERMVARLEQCQDVSLTGHRSDRLPGHVSIVVADVPADVLLLGLDMHGICASSGSACSTGNVRTSHVLSAMGIPDDLARGALRLSMGRTTAEGDVEHLMNVLPPLIERLRKCERSAAA